MSEELKFKHILDQVTGLFHQYGIRSLSMDDISRELGISKKTLYSFVDNKADLVEAILVHGAEQSFGLMASVEGLGLNAIEELLEISNIVHSYHNTMNTAMQFDLNKYYPDLCANFRQGKMKAIEAFVQRNLEKGIREGLYRPDIDIALVANLYIRKMEDIEHPAVVEDREIPYDTIFTVMFENHIRGISNTAGIAYFDKIRAKYTKHRQA